MLPTINQAGKSGAGNAADAQNQRGSINGDIDGSSPSSSIASSLTPPPEGEPITGAAASASPSVLAEPDDTVRTGTRPKTTSLHRRRSSANASVRAQSSGKHTSEAEVRGASGHAEVSQPDDVPDPGRSEKRFAGKQVVFGASAHSLIKVALSAHSPPRLSRRVTFTFPVAEEVTGAPSTDMPVEQKNQAQLIELADQILNLLSEPESVDTFSALQLLRHQFHQAPENYEAFSDLLLERSSASTNTLSELIRQAEREETVAMESTLEATLVNTSETDQKIVAIRTRLAGITNESGAPLPGKEQIAERYRQTIEDLQVALEAATQAEGPTQKLWTGGAKYWQPEDRPFLVQFKELLAEGVFEDQLAFINSIRSTAVLAEIEATLKFGFFDQRLIDAAVNRLQWSSRLTSPPGSPVPPVLPAADVSWHPDTRFEVPVNRMEQYLQRNDYKAAAKYLRRQSNPEIKAHIAIYLHTRPESEQQVLSHLNNPHLSESDSD